MKAGDKRSRVESRKKREISFPLQDLFSALSCSCGLILLLCFTIFAQDSSDVIRVNTELISFEVVVTDRNGKPVRGLDAKDFKVFEDDVERPIEFFEPVKKADDGRPLSVVFALDVSGSVTAAELVELRNALQIFVGRLADYNSYFAVMTFGMQVKTLQSFTNRPDKLEKTFNKLFREQEGLSTHAYDAVDDAVRLLKKKSPAAVNRKPPKRAVVLITDGFPVGDTVTPRTVIERANDAETTVYSILLPSFSRLQPGKKPLLTPLEASGLLEKTGGRAFYATEKSFELLFKSLAEEITASYVVAFYPKTENRQDGKFHLVRIETPKNFQIKQNRAGYEIK
ncbi:MAG TPA: VWA domain-containing protein [Pyrinomonadaceae bacterium]|nr:VWA domain-containing protein [Pyrinomonadaceae bacterium]